MPASCPRRTRPLIFTLAAACILTGIGGGLALRGMHQEELDEQLYTALEHGSTSEMTALLDQGANPNYVPRSGTDEVGTGALFARLKHGNIDFRIKHGPTMLGCTINGLAIRDPRAVQISTQQLKARHILASPVTCTDALAKMRALLEHHADPNRRTWDTNPAVAAIGIQRADALQLLLKFGANPDAPIDSGTTARKEATRSNIPAIMALLTTNPPPQNSTLANH